jgi:hypothetical protein
MTEENSTHRGIPSNTKPGKEILYSTKLLWKLHDLLFGLWGGAKRINRKNEIDVIVNQILWNAVVLVQGLWFIENRERFSPKDDRVTGNSNHRLNHFFGFTGFGVDDFQSADNRETSILKWFETNRLKKDANIIFLNVEVISRLMNECYNDLRKIFPQLSTQRHVVTFQSSRSNKSSLGLQVYLLHCITCHQNMKQCHCWLMNQFGICF